MLKESVDSFKGLLRDVLQYSKHDYYFHIKHLKDPLSNQAIITIAQIPA
jgi:hypothetical protein